MIFSDLLTSSTLSLMGKNLELVYLHSASLRANEKKNHLLLLRYLHIICVRQSEILYKPLCIHSNVTALIYVALDIYFGISLDSGISDSECLLKLQYFRLGKLPYITRSLSLSPR